MTYAPRLTAANVHQHPDTMCQVVVSLRPEIPVTFLDLEGKEHTATGDEDAMCRNQTHDVIYTDGNYALSLYECCYALTDLRSGDVSGSLWDRKEWVMDKDARARILGIHKTSIDMLGMFRGKK